MSNSDKDGFKRALEFETEVNCLNSFLSNLESIYRKWGHLITEGPYVRGYELAKNLRWNVEAKRLERYYLCVEDMVVSLQSGPDVLNKTKTRELKAEFNFLRGLRDGLKTPPVDYTSESE